MSVALAFTKYLDKKKSIKTCQFPFHLHHGVRELVEMSHFTTLSNPISPKISYIKIRLINQKVFITRSFTGKIISLLAMNIESLFGEFW